MLGKIVFEWHLLMSYWGRILKPTSMIILDLGRYFGKFENGHLAESEVKQKLHWNIWISNGVYTVTF